MARASAPASSFGTTCTSEPKISASSSPPGLSVDTHERAAGQRLQGHRGRGLEDGREHEQVGRALQGRDLLVGHQPQEAHGRAEPQRVRLGLERMLHLSRPGHEQDGVGAVSPHFGEGAQQRALIGQRVQALHVEQQRPRVGREPPPHRRALVRAAAGGTPPPPAGYTTEDARSGTASARARSRRARL